MENIFVERLWRSLKYQEGTRSASTMKKRQHQSLGYRTLLQICQEHLWICGRLASPTARASPASRASSESGKMLAFAHMPFMHHNRQEN
jgi:hypothetical protein